MRDETMTAKEIFTMIYNRQVSKVTGISLIENYGLQRQKEFIGRLNVQLPTYPKKIMESIDRINRQLDKMLKAVIGVKS